MQTIIKIIGIKTDSIIANETPATLDVYSTVPGNKKICESNFREY